jgi:hypothetical protein
LDKVVSSMRSTPMVMIAPRKHEVEELPVLGWDIRPRTAGLAGRCGSYFSGHPTVGLRTLERLKAIP